jgi:hypothetical protein
VRLTLLPKERLMAAGAARRRTALLGITAILFQVLLFAWHSHALPFSLPGATPAVMAPSAPLFPAATDDNCPICLALRHSGAVPLAFVGLVLIPTLRAYTAEQEQTLVLQRPVLGFHSRAPPVA